MEGEGEVEGEGASVGISYNTGVIVPVWLALRVGSREGLDDAVFVWVRICELGEAVAELEGDCARERL